MFSVWFYHRDLKYKMSMGSTLHNGVDYIMNGGWPKVHFEKNSKPDFN